VDIASRIPEAFMTHALNDFGSGDNGHWALNLAAGNEKSRKSQLNSGPRAPAESSARHLEQCPFDDWGEVNAALRPALRLIIVVL
jgi:hypothetical protein